MQELKKLFQVKVMKMSEFAIRIFIFMSGFFVGVMLFFFIFYIYDVKGLVKKNYEKIQKDLSDNKKHINKYGTKKI